jgi:hypothetical protein
MPKFSLLTVESDALMSSLSQRTLTACSPKSRQIRDKYEEFKKFVEENTSEEVLTARNYLFSSDPRKGAKSPAPIFNAARPTLSSARKVSKKTISTKKKPFVPVLPSDVKKQKEVNPKNDLRKIFELSPTEVKEKKRQQEKKEQAEKRKEEQKTHYNQIKSFEERQELKKKYVLLL